MLATELRIGNLIGREDGTAIEVTSEIITALQFKDEESRAYCPIALSAEWLDKFGFVRSSDDTYFFSSYPSLELRGQPAHMEVILDGATLLSREFFLHRLQNLVFELTGVEILIREVKDELADAVKSVADGLVSHYVPADRSVRNFNFDLSIEGETYTVSYKKDNEGYWTFEGYNTGLN